jgi:hypothetical protein
MRMNWTGYVAGMRHKNAYRNLIGELDLCRHMRVILKYILRKYDVWVWSGFSCLRVGSRYGFMERR